MVESFLKRRHLLLRTMNVHTLILLIGHLESKVLRNQKSHLMLLDQNYSMDPIIDGTTAETPQVNSEEVEERKEKPPLREDEYYAPHNSQHDIVGLFMPHQMAKMEEVLHLRILLLMNKRCFHVRKIDHYSHTLTL